MSENDDLYGIKNDLSDLKNGLSDFKETLSDFEKIQKIYSFINRHNLLAMVVYTLLTAFFVSFFTFLYRIPSMPFYEYAARLFVNPAYEIELRIFFMFGKFMCILGLVVFANAFFVAIKSKKYIPAIGFSLILIFIIVNMYVSSSVKSLQTKATHCADQFRTDLVILEISGESDVISNLKAKFVMVKTKDDYEAIQSTIIPLKENALKALALSPSDEPI